MSKGYLIFAQGLDYVKQAYVCALSIKKTQKINNVSLVTHTPIPNYYREVFDEVIETPWLEDTATDRFATEHRWKLYHVSPYEETVVLDSDMFFCTDISHWWDYLSKYELYFTSHINTYRGTPVKYNYYREMFYVNDLPDIYMAFHYFKKSDIALEFYKMVELINNNWELFYGKYSPKKYPKEPSMDRTAAIAVKLLGIEDQVTNKTKDFPRFVHMKPKIQGWAEETFSWQEKIPSYYDGDLFFGNYKQREVVHYTENDFFTDEMIKKLEVTYAS